MEPIGLPLLVGWIGFAAGALAIAAFWRTDLRRLTGVLNAGSALLVAFTEDAQKIDHKTVVAGLREIEGPGYVLKSRAEKAGPGTNHAPVRKSFLRLPFLGGRAT